MFFGDKANYLCTHGRPWRDQEPRPVLQFHLEFWVWDLEFQKCDNLPCFQYNPAESLFFPCIFNQPSFCCYPQIGFFIFRNAINPVIGNGIGIIGIICKNLEGVSVVFIKPVLCSKPDVPFRVLENTVDNTLRKSFANGITRKKILLCISCKTTQKKKYS